MLMSMVMTSGFKDSASATASRPSLAWPATWSCGSTLKIFSRTLRMKAESSTISTRVLLEGVAMAGFGCGSGNRLRGLRSNELLDGFGELIFLNWFGEESYGAFLDGAIAMFYASARSDHHHGNAAGGRA